MIRALTDPSTWEWESPKNSPVDIVSFYNVVFEADEQPVGGYNVVRMTDLGGSSTDYIIYAGTQSDGWRIDVWDGEASRPNGEIRGVDLYDGEPWDAYIAAVAMSVPPSGVLEVDMRTMTERKVGQPKARKVDGMKRFDAIRHTIALMLQADIPMVIWGPPGVGKTAFLNYVGRKLSWNVMTKIGSIHEPTDFGGIPARDEATGTFTLLPPDWALELVGETGEKYVLFLDELTTCPAPTQAALLRIVLDRVIGHLAISCKIAAAANPPSSAVGGMELAAPLANRFAHIPWQMEADDYVQGTHTEWAFEPKLLPSGWEGKVQESKLLVANFLISRPQLVTTPLPHGADSMPTFATPRTWEFASKFLAACLSAGAEDEILMIGLSGCIGEGPANEFKTWLKTQALIDVNALIQDAAGGFRKIRGKADVVKAMFSALEVGIRTAQIGEDHLPDIVTAALEEKVDKGSLGAFVEACNKFVDADVMGKVTEIISDHNEKMRKAKKQEGMWEGEGKGWNGEGDSPFVATPSADDIEKLKKAIQEMQSRVKKPTP